MFYFSWKDSGITIIAIVVNVLSSCSSGSWLSTLASEMHRFIFAICTICTTPPPLDVAIEVQIHGQHQQIEMRWYAQIHITIHKKWEDTALWVDDQKNTQVMLESRQTSTDGRSTSRRTGATSWCFYLLGDDHPDHPGTYRVIQKEWEKKTVLMGRGWKHTRGARFSGCQQRVWIRGF